MTPSEEIMARYSRVERQADKFGRVVEVVLLPPSKITSVLRFAASDNKDVFERCLVAASVRRIDEKIYSFPRSAAELDLVMDALDNSGLAAATVALVKLSADDEPAEE